MHKSSESPASNLDTSNNAGVSAVNFADAVPSITAIGGETDCNDSDEVDSVAPLSLPNTVNRINCRWHLTTPAYSATNADDFDSNDSDGSENDDTLSMANAVNQSH